VATPGAKVGPLTAEDLQDIWRGATDESFWRPFEQAGPGQGMEAWTQMFAQFARAAQAADVSMQALYILPWSGQSNPPAAGAAAATVTLYFQRDPQNPYASTAITIKAGQLVAESTTIWGDGGGTLVQTGRTYQLLQDVVLPPGDPGAVAAPGVPAGYSAPAQARVTGYGGNNPLGQWVDANGNANPGTINTMLQPGTGYFHDRGTLVVRPLGGPLPPVQPPLQPGQAVQATLTAWNEAEMFLPQHVGQYVRMTGGVNVGTVGRVNGYVGPQPSLTSPVGSAVQLAYEQCVQVAISNAKALLPGETVNFTLGPTLVATGLVVGWREPAGNPQPPPSATPANVVLVFELQTGAVASGQTVTGVNSAAVGTVGAVLQATTWVAEAPPNPPLVGTGALWQVLDWVADLGIVVSNALQPTGGTSPMLDALGAEREVYRSTAEVGQDDPYRLRIAAVSDVVSPNAIRRALTRSFRAAGFTAPWTFREVGSPQLEGVYFDRVADEAGDFFDTNCLLFTPLAVTGSFLEHEPIRWLDVNGVIVCEGWYARTVPITGQFIFVMHSWRSPARATLQAGDYIQGQKSGAVYQPTTVVQPACTAAMAESVMLDYESFRAYFLVQVPDSEAGEYGCRFSRLGSGDAEGVKPAAGAHAE
jgi:hypothetical protein